MIMCLERGANDLHMVQLMSLPPHHHASLKSDWFYLCGAGLSCSAKEAVKRLSLNG